MNSKQSTLNIKPGNFKSEIELPYSKSYANRALAIASVTEGTFVIKNLATSSDVQTMISCLRELGLEIIENTNGVEIKNSFPECEKVTSDIIKLNTGDGGTTNRILLGILSLGKNTYELCSTEKFKERPNEEAFTCFKRLGVFTKKPDSDDNYWIRLKGPVKKVHELEVDCSETTQFYTGFKLLEFINGTTVIPKNLKTSKRYVEITDHLVDLAKNGEKELTIPVDFSSASYPIVFGSIKNEILIKNCHSIDHFQADSCVIELINKIGGNIRNTDNGLLISPAKLSAFEFNCLDCPDLVPSLVFLALNVDGKSRLKNLSVLRHKESDRIEEILKITKKIGAVCLYNEELDELIIEGVNQLKSATSFDLPADHRMIFLASMILRVGKVSGSVNNYLHVNKSYPDFFEHLQGE